MSTGNKAVCELQYAIDAWIEAAKAAGKRVPAPIIMQPLPPNIVSDGDRSSRSSGQRHSRSCLW
jgi:hypothetical protein